MADGCGELIACSFDTGRVVVRWGDGITAHTSVYQWQADPWGGHWRYVHVPHWRGALEAIAHSTTFGTVEDRASELEVGAHSQGPGIVALQQWLRSEAARVHAEQLAKSAESVALHEANKARGGGKYTAAEQAAFAPLRFDHTLPTTITALASSSNTTRVLGSFLAALRKRLVHGSEIFDWAAEHHASFSGPSNVDAVVYVAVELGLVKPYNYEPRTRLTQDGQLSPAQESAWRHHGRGPWGEHASVTGSQFWLYSRGPVAPPAFD